MAGTKPAHYRGNYHQHSRALVALAYANPGTQCGRCGLTLAEYAGIHGTRRAAWTAGHVNDGEVGGALRPEHLRCNLSAGARHGNAGRQRNRTSRIW